MNIIRHAVDVIDRKEIILSRAFASVVALALLWAPGSVNASLLADIELEFFDSGAGPLAGPYGGDVLGSGFPIPLPDTSNARDGNVDTFVSLPTDSFLTLGFSGGFVFDGPGDDLFVTETGIGDELADVFVSTDGLAFTFLGTAGDAGTETFDLASIGFFDPVNAVRIVGLDLGGGSPGYDLALVEGLEGSVVNVPAPGTLPLLLAAFAGLATVRYRSGRSSAPEPRLNRC